MTDKLLPPIQVLTKYGSQVYVLVRRSELRASSIMAKRLLSNPKIVSPSSQALDSLITLPLFRLFSGTQFLLKLKERMVF